MTNRTVSRVFLCSLIVTSSMVACSGTQMHSRPALATVTPATSAAGIEKALASKSYAQALLAAEALVAAHPRDVSFRTLLGRAYLANGRFASARTAFEDALTLGSTEVRTIISLALIRTATGDADGARDFLADNIGNLPATDYGLAMAIAGNPNEGVRALLEAARAPDATATTRQNLAYALALNGNWGQARLVAGQDLNGSGLQERLSQWAATAEVGAYQSRVAALIGVTPRGDDTGMPQRLALQQNEAVQTAAAEPSPAPTPAAPSTDLAAQAIREAVQSEAPAPVVYAQSQPVEVPVSEAPAVAQVAFAPFSPVVQPLPTNYKPRKTRMERSASAAPVIRAAATPMRQAAVTKPAAVAAAAPAPVAVAATAERAAPAQTGISNWVVQIGAVNDARYLSASWKLSGATAYEAQGYRKLSSQATINGQVWHRMALAGFASRSAAMNLCATLRAKGQSCFVRQDAGVSSATRMARAEPAKPTQTVRKQIASR